MYSNISNAYSITQRIVFEYQDTAESTMHKLFKEKEIKASPDDSWYLQMIFTDAEYQGKGNYSLRSADNSSGITIYLSPFPEGLMSQLVREAFAHSPEDIFTLEATTPKSRDQYAHLGFEVRI